MKLPDQPSLDHQSVVNTQRPAKTGSSTTHGACVYVCVVVCGVCFSFQPRTGFVKTFGPFTSLFLIAPDDGGLFVEDRHPDPTPHLEHTTTPHLEHTTHKKLGAGNKETEDDSESESDVDEEELGEGEGVSGEEGESGDKRKVKRAGKVRVSVTAVAERGEEEEEEEMGEEGEEGEGVSRCRISRKKKLVQRQRVSLQRRLRSSSGGGRHQRTTSCK